MKKSFILSLVLIFTISIFSSCSRKCRGGGWYGDRNLGYVPQENKTDEAAEVAIIHTLEEDCESTAE